MSVRRASKAASRSGSSSSSSGPSSRSSRSYRARRAASPRASASATSRKSCIRKRPRTLARIMPKPPSRAATPRPGVELLARLTMLAQELAGAFRPASVIDLVARALAELLKPDRLSVVLLDAESNRLAVTYDPNAAPPRTDDPPLQLALRRAPLAFPPGVRAEAGRPGAPRYPRVRRADPSARPGDSGPPRARAPAAGVVRPRRAGHRRAGRDLGRDPRGRTGAASHPHPDGRTRLRRAGVRGPDGP